MRKRWVVAVLLSIHLFSIGPFSFRAGTALSRGQGLVPHFERIEFFARWVF